jgi:hypothetical protein
MAKKSTMPKRGKAPAPKPVSAEPDGEKERLTDLAHSDELSRIRQSAWGLCAAVAGLREFNVTEDAYSGVLRLAFDLCDEITDCAVAFKAERRLRLEEEHQ